MFSYIILPSNGCSILKIRRLDSKASNEILFEKFSQPLQVLVGVLDDLVQQWLTEMQGSDNESLNCTKQRQTTVFFTVGKSIRPVVETRSTQWTVLMKTIQLLILRKLTLFCFSSQAITKCFMFSNSKSTRF